MEAAALARFDARPSFRGCGEAEVLVLDDPGLHRGLRRAVRQAVAAELGTARIATSLDRLVWAVRQQRLEVAEADLLLDGLDVGTGIYRELDR